MVRVDSGVTRFDGNTHNIGTKEGLKYGAVQSILQDHLGRFWFGCHSGGLIRYDGNHFQSFGSKEGYPDHDGWSIIETTWGTFGQPIIMESRGMMDNILSPIHPSKAEPEVWHESIIEDRTGRIWIITMAEAFIVLMETPLPSFPLTRGFLTIM